MSTTEKRVIGGLKHLTELLFKEHFKQTGDDQCDSNQPMKSDEMAMNVEYPTSSHQHAFANKENADENGQQFQEDVPSESGPMCDEAEKFCGIVVHQLTSHSNDHSNDQEWHHGQLNAYNWAHDKLFEKK